MVSAVDANPKGAFEVVCEDEFPGDCVFGSGRRELTFDGLVPFGRGVRILGIPLLLVGLNGSIGVGAEPGFVLGVEECGETEKNEQGTHRNGPRK
jgi:hypothetical protein